MESHPHLNLHKLARYSFSVWQFHHSKSVGTCSTAHSGHNMTARRNISHCPAMHIDHQFTTPPFYTAFEASESFNYHNDHRLMTLGQTSASAHTTAQSSYTTTYPTNMATELNKALVSDESPNKFCRICMDLKCQLTACPYLTGKRDKRTLSMGREQNYEIPRLQDGFLCFNRGQRTVGNNVENNANNSAALNVQTRKYMRRPTGHRPLLFHFSQTVPPHTPTGLSVTSSTLMSRSLHHHQNIPSLSSTSRSIEYPVRSETDSTH